MHGSDPMYGSDPYNTDNEQSSGPPVLFKNIEVVHSDPSLEGTPFTVGATVKIEWETENFPMCSNIYSCNSYIDLNLIYYQNENVLSVPERPSGLGHAPEVCDFYELDPDNCKCRDLPECWETIMTNNIDPPMSSVGQVSKNTLINPMSSSFLDSVLLNSNP